MSLPIEWVEKIFKKLTVTFGRDFLGRYEGIPLIDIKTDWAHELSGFEAHPEAIRHALQNINPSKPPTVYEFRNVCAAAPKMIAKALPLPPQDPAIVAAIVNGLKAKPAQKIDFKDWARAILTDHAEGRRRTPTVVQMAKNALEIA